MEMELNLPAAVEMTASFGGRATAGWFSYRRVTVAVCIGNLVAALLVLRSLTSYFAPAAERVEVVQYTEEQIRRVEESIRIRREAEPVELVQAVTCLAECHKPWWCLVLLGSTGSMISKLHKISLILL